MTTETQLTESGHRPIYEIATEILKDWKKPYFGAIPYLQAMQRIGDIKEKYGYEDAQMVVLYFLSNAQTWRGETARRIKKELNAIAK